MMSNMVRLGDIAKVVSGSGFPKKYQRKNHGEYPFFKVSDMNLNGNEIYMYTAANYVGYDDLKVMKAKTFPAGTIIFPKIGGAISTNKKRMLTQISAFDNNVMGVVPIIEKITAEYLYKIFVNLDLYELSNKAALPSIKKGAVESIEFPFLPLKEQKAIVAKLDKAFVEIDKMIAAAECNAENSEALISSYLNEFFKKVSHTYSKVSLCDSSRSITYGVVKLGDVCCIKNGGTPKSNEKSYWGTEIQWLTPKDMGKLTGRYVSETERQITRLGLDNSSAKLVPENSVILSSRAPIGHVAINEVPMSFNQGCKGLVPNEFLTTEYLYYFLIVSKLLLNELGTGTTFKEITAKTLSNVEIPLPPLSEQKAIVVKLDAVFSRMDNVIQITDKQIVNYQELKSAILAQELQGETV